MKIRKWMDLTSDDTEDSQDEEEIGGRNLTDDEGTENFTEDSPEETEVADMRKSNRKRKQPEKYRNYIMLIYKEAITRCNKKKMTTSDK